MYERFTDRSRRTMQLAQQEAIRINHEYVGTEHILLGLIKEGGGVAAEILKGMKIDLRAVRLAIEVETKHRSCSGPDVIIGKLPLTPRSKKVIEYAMEYSRLRNDNFVGTFHILLGLLKEGEGVAATILKKFDVSESVLIDAEQNYVKDHASEAVVGTLEIKKQAAIANMDFEKAAQIRDRIDAFKKQMSPAPDRIDQILSNQEEILTLLKQLVSKD